VSANTFAVGALVTPHIHTREDEYSIAIGPLGRLRRIPVEALREYVERLRVEASGKSPAA
jgi:hypothetical protein